MWFSYIYQTYGFCCSFASCSPRATSIPFPHLNQIDIIRLAEKPCQILACRSSSLIQIVCMDEWIGAWMDGLDRLTDGYIHSLPITVLSECSSSLLSRPRATANGHQTWRLIEKQKCFCCWLLTELCFRLPCVKYLHFSISKQPFLAFIFRLGDDYI